MADRFDPVILRVARGTMMASAYGNTFDLNVTASVEDIANGLRSMYHDTKTSSEILRELVDLLAPDMAQQIAHFDVISTPAPEAQA